MLLWLSSRVSVRLFVVPSGTTINVRFSELKRRTGPTPLSLVIVTPLSTTAASVLLFLMKIVPVYDPERTYLRFTFPLYWISTPFVDSSSAEFSVAEILMSPAVILPDVFVIDAFVPSSLISTTPSAIKFSYKSASITALAAAVVEST